MAAAGRPPGRERPQSAAMNAWFDRYLAALGAAGIELEREEAAAVLDVAGAASRSAGARPFAPIAAYLAGRLAAGAGAPQRLELLRAAVAAATDAGEATEPLDLD